MTKTYKTRYATLIILSIILNIAPIVIYAILGFVNGAIHEKLTLGCMLSLAIIFVAINIIFKHQIRSTIWIILIGIHSCIDNIVPLLMIMAVCTILDEFVISPLIKKYKQLYIINKEIDKR